VRPPVADSQWLQIYSPIRTPASSRLHIDDFELDGPTLGEGSFAKVKLGTHVPSNKKVAVKIIDKTKIPANIKAYAATEPGVLCRLKHANVVKMLLTHETDTEIYIFLQFMAGCDMHSYIQQKQYLLEEEARKLFVQMLDGCAYIHKEGVVHRDIKLENILISHKKVNGVRKALLIDFGFAAVVPHSDYKFTDHPGSLCYASPELLAGEKYDGTKVDVYALGVTLYTMLHGVYPFYSPDQRELTMKILNDPVECASDVTDECADLLRMMMAKNPDERPSMRAIKSHPWMKDATNPITKKTIMTPVMSRLREGLHNMSPKKGGRKLAF
jgi:5'-AMP-activated protein kinase, catalytic alpha subunit